jgi:hypothetical protein
MILQIALNSFYSRGDERRLFQGFNEIAAIRNVQGVGRDLLIDIKITNLTNEDMRELLALLWRYKMPLTPLQIFAAKKRFHWLNDTRGYWHTAMFKSTKAATSLSPRRHSVKQ